MAGRSMGPSEFGGKTQPNGIQPPRTPRGQAGHTMTESERLRMIYQTGQDEDSTAMPDNGEAFSGLVDIETQKASLPPVKNVYDEELEI